LFQFCSGGIQIVALGQQNLRIVKHSIPFFYDEESDLHPVAHRLAPHYIHAPVGRDVPTEIAGIGLPKYLVAMRRVSAGFV
jgi:hypothetical protein